MTLGGDEGETENSEASQSATSPATTASSAGVTSQPADSSGDTGVLPEDCEENLLGDPGFELGTPNPSWEEASPLFGSPICDATCTEDVGAGPLSGAWWVWFGGIEMPDTPSVSQEVVVPVGGAVLAFGFSINAAAGGGNDVFTVTLDDETLFIATDDDIVDYGGWQTLLLDVSDFGDGAAHTLRFSGSLTGAGVTNFFVDDVALVSCEAPVATSSGGFDTGSSGSSSSSGGADGSTTGTDTEADVSSSSSSSSSSGSGSSSSSSSSSSGMPA